MKTTILLRTVCELTAKSRVEWADDTFLISSKNAGFCAFLLRKKQPKDTKRTGVENLAGAQLSQPPFNSHPEP